MAKIKLLKWEATISIENLALCVMLFVPFFNMFFMFGYNTKLYLTGGLLAILILLRLLKPSSWSKATTMSIILIGFLTVQMFLKNFPSSFSYYILILTGYLMIRVRFSKQSIYWALSVIEYVGVFYAITVIWQWFSPGTFYPVLKKFVSEGPYNQAIQLALFDNDYSGFAAESNRAGVCIAPATCVLFSKMVFKKDRANIPKTMRNVILFVLTYFGIVLTGRRAFILFFPTVIILLCLFFMYKSRKKSIKILGFITSITIALIVVFFLKDAIIHLLTRGEGTGIALRNREIYWGLAFDMFKKSPIIGMGMRSYDYFYNILSGRDIVFAGAHNCYFQLLAEIGALGTLIFICFIVSNAVRTAKRSVLFIRKDDSRNGKPAIMSLLMQGMFIFLALSESAFFAPYSLVLYFLLVNISENTEQCNAREVFGY